MAKQKDKPSATQKRIDEFNAMNERFDRATWEVIDFLFGKKESISVSIFRSVRYFVMNLGIDGVLDACEIALKKMYGCGEQDKFKYFCGVCWNFIRAEQECE